MIAIEEVELSPRLDGNASVIVPKKQSLKKALKGRGRKDLILYFEIESPAVGKVERRCKGEENNSMRRDLTMTYSKRYTLESAHGSFLPTDP